MRTNKIISILLAAVFTCAAAVPAANAADWVTVSSWAYNDVSNFTNAGLLPESMEAVEDYTQSITRLQFAEMVFSVLKAGKCVTEHTYENIDLADTDSPAAKVMCGNDIMKGEVYVADAEDSGAFAYGRNAYSFYPDRLLTREEMAAVICRAIEKYNLLSLAAVEQTEISDIAEVSDWAADHVKTLVNAKILFGTGDGCFRPKDNLSIEQAVSLLYRIYSSLPIISSADGAGLLTDTEQTVQTYSNGVTETREGNTLFLKRASIELMSFETDIYSNIYCVDRNKMTYAAAQTVKGATEVYNADTGALLFKIPYPTYSMDENEIIVKSDISGPFTFGLYDYSGNELIEPKYCLSEIEEICANGMRLPADERKEASGWIYYPNKDDENKLYRIDSNGENDQKVLDKSCTRLSYAGGWLIYRHSTGKFTYSSPIYCMKPENGKEYVLFETGGDYPNAKWTSVYPMEQIGYDLAYDGNFTSRKVTSGISFNTLCFEGRYLYCTVLGENNTERLYSVDLSGDEPIVKEVSGGSDRADNIQFRDGTVYFIGLSSEGEMRLCSYDGSELKMLSGDRQVIDYGFGKDGKLRFMERDTRTVYFAGADSDEIAVDEKTMTERKKGEDLYRNTNDAIEIERWEWFSDDKYDIYREFRQTEVDDDFEYSHLLMQMDADGNKKAICDLRAPMLRLKNTLYFKAAGGAKNGISKIEAYDLDTGEWSRVLDDILAFEGPICTAGDGWFTYFDSDTNIRRCNVDTGRISEVYPSGGLHRCGKLQQMFRTDKGIYKTDTDGNYLFITDAAGAESILYVENGTGRQINIG